MAFDTSHQADITFDKEGIRIKDLTRVGEVGRAIGCLLPESEHPVLVGKNTARENYVIEMYLVGGLLQAGFPVKQTGPLPVPAVASLTHSMRAELGIFISGRVPPPQDQKDKEAMQAMQEYERGALIRIFDAKGAAVSMEYLSRVCAHSRVAQIECLAKRRPAKATRIDDAQARYIEMVKSKIPDGLRFDGMRIAVDCNHGSFYEIAPRVLHELGAEVKEYGKKPSGFNLDRESAEHPKLLAERVREFRCDYGLAINGDGTRAYLIDKDGRPYPKMLYKGLEAVNLSTAPAIGDPFVYALQTLAVSVRIKNGSA